MMARKHLYELLREDQEPFLLEKSNNGEWRRSQLKRSIVESSNSRRSLFHGHRPACFLSFQDSPDAGKLPHFRDFSPPTTARSLRRSPNTVLLRVPSTTAALLLEAALKIQKQKPPRSSKHKCQIKNVGFGLFGCSILKRLSGKNRSRKLETGGGGSGFSVRKSAGKSEKAREIGVAGNENSSCARSCSKIRRNRDVWSGRNECAFRFALQKCRSPTRLTPGFSSPATSPNGLNKEKKKCKADSLQKIRLQEQEEKEQCSPVSVLDPPFADDVDDGRGHDRDGKDGCDHLHCSYTIAQRTKQLLLHKLRRFEKHAALDPIELEKNMLSHQEEKEEEEEHSNENLEEEDELRADDVDDSLPFYSEKNIADGFVVGEDLSEAEISADMKKLVLDLIAEEKKVGEDSDEVAAMKRVWKRFESWKKEVESNTTIDMMVELDFRRSGIEEWRRNGGQEQVVGETAMEIERAIFGLLVEEVSEVVCLSTGVLSGATDTCTKFLIT